jgi:hypothetical protein
MKLTDEIIKATIACSCMIQAIICMYHNDTATGLICCALSFILIKD